MVSQCVHAFLPFPNVFGTTPAPTILNSHGLTRERAVPLISITRTLAARQCAQARTELALALGRLSTRSAFVSDTQTAARRTSAHHRTLLLRLVDLELRHWQELAAAASAASENVEVRLRAAKKAGAKDSGQKFVLAVERGV